MSTIRKKFFDVVKTGLVQTGQEIVQGFAGTWIGKPYPYQNWDRSVQGAAIAAVAFWAMSSPATPVLTSCLAAVMSMVLMPLTLSAHQSQKKHFT